MVGRLEGCDRGEKGPGEGGCRRRSKQEEWKVESSERLKSLEWCPV